MSDWDKALTIGLAMPMAVPGDVNENITRMEPLVREAARRGAHVAVFSECAITGYDMNDVGLNAALSLQDKALDRVAEMAWRHNIAIITSMYENLDGKHFNTALVFHPDGQRVIQRKHAIIDHERDHTDVQSAPRERVLFELRGLKCAILICSDNGIPNIKRDLAEQGCEVVFSITAGCGRESWGFHQADLEDPQRYAKYLDISEKCCFPGRTIDWAVKCKMAFASCNQQGWLKGTGYFHPGHCFLVDRTGEVKALIPGRFVFEHLHPDLAVGTVHGAER